MEYLAEGAMAALDAATTAALLTVVCNLTVGRPGREIAGQVLLRVQR